MSAICGMFELENNIVDGKISAKMLDILKGYSFDRINNITNQQIFFGCGLQHITPESLQEVLPFYDKRNDLIITADAIIDNRGELLKQFEVQQQNWTSITDSQIILMAYCKWGKDSPKYLVGDFAFAIWDNKKKELFCARDHVGTRILYYYYDKKIFGFCTLMKPLSAICEGKFKVNERWIADFLALPGVVHELECNDTIYQGILQLEPACALTVDKSGIHKIKYWDPLKDIKPLRFKSDEEYEAAFRNVLEEAVECRLRSCGEVGVMLSGGLDSGAVACISARKLASEGKALKAFSAIPIKEYKNNLPEYCIADESEYIREISEKYDNVQITYTRSEGKNSLSDVKSFVHILEQPYKTIQNLFWIDELVKTAADSNCKVLLSGQFGNSTISFGDLKVNLITLFRQARFITLLKELRKLSEIYGYSIYYLCKTVLKMSIPYNIRKAIFNHRYKTYDRFYESPVDTSLIDKWDIDRRFFLKKIHQHVPRFNDIKEIHKAILNPMGLNQMGTMETKMGLNYGLVERDPTRDKRVIEFFLSLPVEQLVKDGMERTLIRKAMKGILPDKIRLNTTTRGKQSADAIQRLIPIKEEIYLETKNCICDKRITKYINRKKLERELSRIENLSEESAFEDLHMFLTVLILLNFFEENEKILCDC